MSRNMEVANTILQQLGGRRFASMTGAKNMTAIDQGLQFSLPANFAKDGINRVRVVLDPSDTYTVTFERVRGKSCKQIASYDDVYCDQLEDLFEDQTGLVTSLGGHNQFGGFTPKPQQGE